MLGRLLKRRMPAYFGGLLLSLAAMVLILQAKKAFAPKFHEVSVNLTTDEIAPGGKVVVVYDDEPGYFLPPGFPTKLVISRMLDNGAWEPVTRLAYRNLVDRESGSSPLDQAGKYLVKGDLYICASPGIADCTLYLFSKELNVRTSSKVEISQIKVDLKSLAQKGLDAGTRAEQP